MSLRVRGGYFGLLLLMGFICESSSLLCFISSFLLDFYWLVVFRMRCFGGCCFDLDEKLGMGGEGWGDCWMLDAGCWMLDLNCADELQIAVCCWTLVCEADDEGDGW